MMHCVCVRTLKARARPTCCVTAKPMTGSPSGMSHVTTAELAFTALMVTLTGGDKLSANTRETNAPFISGAAGTGGKLPAAESKAQRRCEENKRPLRMAGGTETPNTRH